MQPITPCLWFNGSAEEAVNFYKAVFKNVSIGATARYDAASAEASGMPEGTVLTIEFEINGRKFLGLNGGPAFPFTEAVSFMVACDTQEEIDGLWEKLTADGGEESQCGWLKDKFGLSWQIVPSMLSSLVSGPDAEKSKRAMEALMRMKKLDIETLKNA